MTDEQRDPRDLTFAELELRARRVLDVTRNVVRKHSLRWTPESGIPAAMRGSRPLHIHGLHITDQHVTEGIFGRKRVSDGPLVLRIECLAEMPWTTKPEHQTVVVPARLLFESEGGIAAHVRSALLAGRSLATARQRAEFVAETQRLERELATVRDRSARLEAQLASRTEGTQT